MIAMAIDGVLRDTNSGGSIPTGVLLYRALVDTTGVALIAGDKDEARVSHWLLTNNLVDHNYLVMPRTSDSADPGEARVRQIIRLKESGSVDGLFESNPAVAESVFLSGVPVYLFVSPVYSQPEFLPGYKAVPTPWSSLLGEIERQESIKAGDTRLTQELV